jgi:hypothetical protein
MLDLDRVHHLWRIDVDYCTKGYIKHLKNNHDVPPIIKQAVRSPANRDPFKGDRGKRTALKLPGTGSLPLKVVESYDASYTKANTDSTSNVQT